MPSVAHFTEGPARRAGAISERDLRLQQLTLAPVPDALRIIVRRVVKRHASLGRGAPGEKRPSSSTRSGHEGHAHGGQLTRWLVQRDPHGFPAGHLLADPGAAAAK